jgi:hypothetical protein
MATVTVEDVANQALAYLSEAPIASLDDDSKAARLLNTFWDTVVQVELEVHKWGFAIREETLTGIDLGTDDGTLKYQFDVPADFIAIVPVKYDDRYEGVPINWRFEGGYLYTDQSATQYIRYVAYVDDPADWPAYFVEVIATALAVRIAEALTGKQSLVQGAEKAYEKAVSRGMRANNQNKGRLVTERWDLQRGDTRFYRP